MSSAFATLGIEPIALRPPIILSRGQTKGNVKRFEALGQLVGEVTQVSEGSFVAELFDSEDSVQPTEVVEVLFRELSPDDIPLVVAGAVFYWSIGYETNRSGTNRRVSIIRFRRSPLWSKANADAIRARAEQIRAEVTKTNGDA